MERSFEMDGFGDPPAIRGDDVGRWASHDPDRGTGGDLGRNFLSLHHAPEQCGGQVAGVSRVRNDAGERGAQSSQRRSSLCCPMTPISSGT